MQQHILFSRKNKLIIVLIVGLLTFALIISAILITKNSKIATIECRGQIRSVFGDNQTFPEFRGIYTFSLEGSQGYISVNGVFISAEKTYTVQRVTRISAEKFSPNAAMYELKSVEEKVLTGDDLPERLYQRYILSPISVITIGRTLDQSYLIRNLYSPVLVCSEYK